MGRALGINNGNSRHAQYLREVLDELSWESLKAERAARLQELKNEQRALYRELIELDPEGGEAWFDDEQNVPEFGTFRERIRLLRARIADLRARKEASGGE